MKTRTKSRPAARKRVAAPDNRATHSAPPAARKRVRVTALESPGTPTVPPAPPEVAATCATAALDVAATCAEPGPADPDQEFLRSLDSLYRSFRMKACEVWPRSRLNLICARTVTRLQTAFPGFDPASLTPETASGVFEMIEALLHEAPWWRRRALKREAMHLVAELYNTCYEALRDHAMLERVEQLYLSIKE